MEGASTPLCSLGPPEKMVAQLEMKHYYECCGKSICGGCIHSFSESGNIGTCPYCRADRMANNDERRVEDIMKRIEIKDK